MQKYIALLRGINVGGKNKVSMPLLKEAFEQAGFLEVSTYINSGNVIFSSEQEDIPRLTKICEDAIAKKFGLSIPVGVVSSDQLADAVGAAPEWWDIKSEQEMVHQAIFLIPPITAEEVFTAVGEPKPEFEQVGHYNNVIFWSAERATFSKTKWCKISSSSVYSRVTIRNANTTKKLLALCAK